MVVPIRLLLVDYPTLSLRALAALLNRRHGLRVIGQAASGPEALAAVSILRPDVAVVEPEVPNGGPQLVAALSQAAPECAVLALTLSSDASAAGRLLHAGARGCLLKDCEPDDLVGAIRRVRAGELLVAPSIGAAVLRDLSGEAAVSSSVTGLTEREREIPGLVALGLTNPQIARELSITEHTVKGHLVNVLRKLGLDNRVQLAAFATQHGLVAPIEQIEDRVPPSR